MPGITPACAGNTFPIWKLYSTPQDHPRLRGEYSTSQDSRKRTVGSPPLARGIHWRPEQELDCEGITPACAGNTSVYALPSNPLRDHPRLRGEYCLSSRQVRIARGSPPLARGIHRIISVNVNLPGITPACAGNTLDCRLIQLSPWDHPRLRGEYVTQHIRRGKKMGSPPLARGIPQKFKRLTGIVRITPACAGNTA